MNPSLTPQLPTPAALPPESDKASSFWSSPWATYLGLMLVLGLLIAFFSFRSEYFWSSDTFVTIANDIPGLAVMAVGMTFVLIIAGIDLSVGSVLALSAAISAVAILQWQWSAFLGGALGLIIGLLCGAANGLISVIWKIPSFIVSLGLLEAVRGSAYLVTDSRTQYVGSAMGGLSSAHFSELGWNLGGIHRCTGDCAAGTYFINSNYFWPLCDWHWHQ